MKDLLNYCQLSEDIGTAGQPTVEQLSLIAEQQYTAVINLAMHDSDNAIPEEGNIVASLGMSYYHMPVPFDQPQVGHVGQFFRIMEALDGEKVFVHCAVNARVSAFVYKYLTLKKGCESELATTPLLTQWLPQMDEKWSAIMGLRLEEIEENQH